MLERHDGLEASFAELFVSRREVNSITARLLDLARSLPIRNTHSNEGKRLDVFLTDMDVKPLDEFAGLGTHGLLCDDTSL